MNTIVIAVPTYKRPAMLKKLIVSIAECNVDKTLIQGVSLIVVDNDIDKTAEKIVLELLEEFSNVFNLHYYNYPLKGLSNVRNELLRKSLALHPDFIVFIDDDEFVTTEWLNELVNTIEINQADAARGPVIAKLNNPVSKYILRLFERERHKNNDQLATWTTGNLILRRTSLEKYNIWFDNRFNSVGSEDTYFGVQMAKKGAIIFWSEKAIAFETIPEKRTEIKWFVNRVYRGATMFTFILKLEKNYFELAKKILVSFFYIAFGLSALVLYVVPIRYKYLGILKLSEGVGGLAGLFNLQYNEYK